VTARLLGRRFDGGSIDPAMRSAKNNKAIWNLNFQDRALSRGSQIFGLISALPVGPELSLECHGHRHGTVPSFRAILDETIAGLAPAG